MCLAGECPAGVARVAFVEAAREAGIHVDTTPRPPDRKAGALAQEQAETSILNRSECDLTMAGTVRDLSSQTIIP